MARARGVDPKRFRAALRQAGLSWHSHNGLWEVCVDSTEHGDLLRILATLGIPTAHRDLVPPASSSPTGRITSPRRTRSDEAWVIDLCDQVLERTAFRQHRFPFFVGDPGASGRRAQLPVDAYYPDLALVVEYHEPQHSKPVGFFDRRPTVSGVARGEQRRRYDELRRTVLPANGLKLVILDYSEFAHTAAGRLLRTERDRDLIARRFAPHANRL